MILKENSLFGTVRGLSVASKKMNVSGMRNIEPKFFKGLSYERPSSIKKNQYPSTITILKKQNLAPQITSLEEPTQSKQKKESPAVTTKRREEVCDIRIYPRGLYNIGNTCYMNATLQCLFHLKHFSKILMNQINKWPGSQKSIPPVASQLSLALKQMFTKQGAPLNLGNLKKNLGKKKPIFLGNAQQDAQQYLTNLLQILNEQLTRISKKNKYKQLEGDPTKKSIQQISDQWWNYYMEIDNSIVCDAFQGQTISTIKCKKCNKASVNFDNIWGLPITFHKNMSVFNLLINNWKSETHVQDYYCSQCKQHRNCTKVVELYRLPKYLVIQLKRFQFERGQKKKRKEEIKVDKELNVQKLLNESAKRGNDCKYKLKGVVHHYGQAQYGHYYAEVFCDTLGKWFNVNDSSVDQIEFTEASKTAYLLFYEQIS